MPLLNAAAGELPACRMCASQGTMRDLGSLPDTAFFAGVRHAKPIPGGRLLQCSGCDSMQRFPILDQDAYTALYAQGESEIWVQQPGRMDIEMAKRAIQRESSLRSVLDVGCSGGDFLASLPSVIEKFGIEPSLKAASLARSRGIQTVVSDIGELDRGRRFDCIAAIDVIEHVAHPDTFLDQLVPKVAEGGILIVSTGDPRAFPWSGVFRSKYWYSSFPEHISFPSRTFFQQWAGRAGFVVEQHARFSYFASQSLARRAAQVALQLTFLLSRALHRATVRLIFTTLLKRNVDTSREFFLPCAGLFEDHQFCVLRKTSS